jgi:hypothetical protein
MREIELTKEQVNILKEKVKEKLKMDDISNIEYNKTYSYPLPRFVPILGRLHFSNFSYLDKAGNKKQKNLIFSRKDIKVDEAHDKFLIGFFYILAFLSIVLGFSNNQQTWIQTFVVVNGFLYIWVAISMNKIRKNLTLI